MNSFKCYLLSICLLCSAYAADAQQFLKKNSSRKRLGFVEMQKKFDEWSHSVDLKTTRHWKYYKRWENDMQFKANGHGELADPSVYIDEAVKAAAQKQQEPSARFSSAAWSPVGPFALPGNLTGYMQNGIGRINCMAFHPTDPDTYFVGVAQGGVWKTTNNGGSWTPLTDNLPIMRISDITIDPNNTNVMYISVCDFEYIDVALNIDGRKRNTHYGLGVYKTVDGGLNWTPTGLSFQLTDGDASLIRKVVINPANSNQLVACGVSGMYTSANGGSSWTHTLDTLFWDLVQDKANPNVLYAASGWLAASNYGYAAIYKSTNFGASWTMLSTGIPATGSVQRIKLAIAPSDPNYVYAFAVDAVDGMYGIYKSINAGTSWQFLNPGVNVLEGNDGSNPGGQGTYDLGFNVSPADKNIVYTGGVNIWASTDGAVTFNPASHWTLSYGATLHGDIHFIEPHPITGELFVCSDGGIYRTDNFSTQTWSAANSGSPWPTTWTDISDGLAITSFYRLSSSRNATGRLVAGAQDNATFYYDGSSWNTIFGGDGMDNYLDPVDDDVVIGSSQYGNFYLSPDGGISAFDPGVNVNFERGEWTSPIVADYNIYGTLYAGLTNVNASNDGGNSWYALSPLPSNGIYDNELSALAVANSNSNVIYAARRIRFEFGSPSGAYRTTDGGGSWSDITSNLPDSIYYTAMDVSQTDANTAYISLAGLVAGEKVYRTTDGGASWQNISYNLPNVPVNSVKTVPVSGELMVATDLGVYIFNAAANNWVARNTGLPNVIVSDIEFNPALNKIYVSTFGRGIWESDLSSMVNVKDIPETNINIELYPSPNNGSFSISLSGKGMTDKALQLEVVDVMGRRVYAKTLEGELSYSFSLGLAPGLYFAKISGEKLNGVKSFVVK
ncbi:MAG: glycosyl hydrolase repeat-containing protein [Bacteroidetes bacterium]|nr:glycosyl hydrolase repeat-containing protein [Bacteroidota bacterium]